MQTINPAFEKNPNALPALIDVIKDKREPRMPLVADSTVWRNCLKQNPIPKTLRIVGTVIFEHAFFASHAKSFFETTKKELSDE